MALITCPECGHRISDKARKCPRCGIPIAQGATAPRRETAHSAGSKSSNKLPYIVAAATVALLAIVAGIYLLKDKDSTHEAAPIVNETVTECDKPHEQNSDNSSHNSGHRTDNAQNGNGEASNRQNSTPSNRVEETPRQQDGIPSRLSQFTVTSMHGYGANVRKTPSTSAQIIKIYREGTTFSGAYTDLPNWIMIVQNNRIIGYIHDENVSPYY